MLGLVGESLVDFIMSNHIYTVLGELFHQDNGGPIGLDFTRVLARLAMIVFDRELKTMITKSDMDLQLMLRYVDDGNIAVDVLDNGQGRQAMEKTTAELLKKMADSIFPGMFSVTTDFPCNNVDNKMPILDLKVWVDSTGTILHEYYRKPTSYRGVVQSKSGITYKMKENIIFNEGLRRLSNCSPEIDWKTKASLLSELNLFMYQGGYDYTFRSKVTDKIIRIYSTILSKHNAGTNMYRQSQTNRRQKSKTDWYKQKGYQWTVQAPCTVDQKLAKDIKNRLEKSSGQKVLMQEMYGKTVSSSLSNANPCPDKICHRLDCKICLSGTSNGRCFTNNIGYRISCNRDPCNQLIDNNKLSDEQVRMQLQKINPDRQTDCKPAIYEGETFRSAYTRSKQWWQRYNCKSGQKTSALWHHTNTMHGGKIGDRKGEKDYKFAITKTFRNNLGRQSDEGKRQTVLETFQQQDKVQVLNSKIDFCQPLRTRLTVINKNTNQEPGQIETRQDRPLVQTKTNNTTTTTFTPTLTSTPNKIKIIPVTTNSNKTIPRRLELSPAQQQPFKRVRFNEDIVD